MTSISDYLTCAEYAEMIGVSAGTLKKRMEKAVGTDYALPEPIKKGAMRLYLIDDWKRMNAGRLTEAIDEAVSLGLVVRIQDHLEINSKDYNSGYEKGFEAGVRHVASDLPEDGSEDLELLEYSNVPAPEVPGLTHGGFQPLSSLGL